MKPSRWWGVRWLRWFFSAEREATNYWHYAINAPVTSEQTRFGGAQAEMDFRYGMYLNAKKKSDAILRGDA